MARTSIVVVAYNHGAYLPACLRALEAAVGPSEARLILIDNASSDGTAERVRRELLSSDGTRTRGGLPVVFLANGENLGFSGGNNQALRQALADGDEFAYLLNPDTEVEPGFLAPALAAAAGDPRIAEVQSLLVRLPGGDTVNTWGNALHYLGFGYAAGDGTPLDAPATRARLAGVRDIAYASGAGVLVRLAALREVGFLDETLFAYHEDLELSWRLRLAGWRVVLAPASRVGHRYEFGRSMGKMYLMERNRFLVLAWCYRARTLALLAPALLAMEAGLWLFAARAGWWREKGRAYRYLVGAEGRRALREGRRRVQALRQVSDRAASALFTGEVIFPAVSPWLLTHVANPLFAAYWALARAMMRW
jgi:GT2 family glycosyltransferase